LDFEPCSAWSFPGDWSLEIGLFRDVYRRGLVEHFGDGSVEH
jgi:hypothetical protein